MKAVHVVSAPGCCGKIASNCAEFPRSTSRASWQPVGSLYHDFESKFLSTLNIYIIYSPNPSLASLWKFGMSLAGLEKRNCCQDLLFFSFQCPYTNEKNRLPVNRVKSRSKRRTRVQPSAYACRRSRIRTDKVVIVTPFLNRCRLFRAYIGSVRV